MNTIKEFVENGDLPDYFELELRFGPEDYSVQMLIEILTELNDWYLLLDLYYHRYDSWDGRNPGRDSFIRLQIDDLLYTPFDKVFRSDERYNLRPYRWKIVDLNSIQFRFDGPGITRSTPLAAGLIFSDISSENPIKIRFPTVHENIAFLLLSIALTGGEIRSEFKDAIIDMESPGVIDAITEPRVV